MKIIKKFGKHSKTIIRVVLILLLISVFSGGSYYGVNYRGIAGGATLSPFGSIVMGTFCTSPLWIIYPICKKWFKI